MYPIRDQYRNSPKSPVAEERRDELEKQKQNQYLECNAMLEVDPRDRARCNIIKFLSLEGPDLKLEMDR